MLSPEASLNYLTAMKYLNITTICLIMIAAFSFVASTELGAQANKEKIRLLSSALRAHDAGDLDAARRNLVELLNLLRKLLYFLSIFVLTS